MFANKGYRVLQLGEALLGRRAATHHFPNRLLKWFNVGGHV
jgi:hypothetical protein